MGFPSGRYISDNSAAGHVVYADDEAARLLRQQIEQLSQPARSNWMLIKQNASRSVYRGRIDGQEIYLNHFHSRSRIHRMGNRVGASDAQVEFDAMQYLASHGVRTLPALAAQWDNGAQWVATRAVSPAIGVDDWHQQQLEQPGGAARIRRMTVALGRLIAHMHAAGVLHNDLHCGNVLVSEGPGGQQLVLTDLHRTAHRRRLSRRRRAANLAQLLHDRYEWTSRTDRLRFLRTYLRESRAEGSLRGWQLQIEHFARRHRARQHRQRDRRILGNNRYFHALRLPGGWSGHVVLASKRKPTGSRAAGAAFTPQQWIDALGDLDAIDRAPDAVVLKDTRSGRVVRRRLVVGGVELDVFIKRPRRKRPWKLLCDCARQSRALRAFRLGHALLTRRIATALPLAAFERRVGPFLTDSILITEAVQAPVLQEFLETWLSQPPRGDVHLSAAQQRHLAQEVLARLGRMLQDLHASQYAHRDLKATNMLVHWSQGQRPELVLIDLDGLKRLWRVSERRKVQGLMRLNVSLLLCPSVNHAGRLRMLLGYLRRPGCGRIAYKPYWRVLEKWSARKIRQQIRSRRKRQWATRRPQT